MANQTAPPLEMEDLKPQLVTDAGGFTTLQYLDQRERTPSQWEKERQAEQVLPGAPAAFVDIFHTLSAHEPEMRSVEAIRPDRRYVHDILEQAMETEVFQELRLNTMGSDLLAFMGTQEVMGNVISLVPKKDKKQLRDMADKQADADEAEQQAQDAEAQAETFQQMLNDLEQRLGQPPSGQQSSPGQPGAPQPGQGQPAPGQGSPSGQPGQGQPSGSGAPSSSSGQGQPGQGGSLQPGAGQSTSGSGQPTGNPVAGKSQLTAEQAKMLANRAAELRKLQGDAQAARELANEAKAAAQAAADALLGKPGTAEAEQKLTELRRLGMGALKQAAKKVEKAADTIETWGFEEGELSEMPPDTALALVEQVGNIKNVADILGRLRKMTAKKAKSETDGETKTVSRLERGRDLSRLHLSELNAFAASPVTKLGFMQRWGNGTLLLNGKTTKKTLGKGPFVVCEDVSTSTAGPKHEWSTATSLALAYYAKLKKRDFARIVFESVVKSHQLYKDGRMTPQQVLQIAQTGVSGGTNFEAPIRKAVEMIRTAGGLKNADIVFITDGECAVSDEFLKWLKAAKEELKFTILAIVCDSGGSVSDATLRLFADRIERVSTFTVEEAEKKVFGRLAA